MTDAAGLDGFARAGLHPVTHGGPAPNFFSGAVLGNGALGVVVCTRPDAIVLRLGHNDVWDRRISTAAVGRVGTFAEIFARVAAIHDDGRLLEDDPWFGEYCRDVQSDYRAEFPRPYPCGSLILGWDYREYEVLGHRLDVSTGRCQVRLRRADGELFGVEVFCERGADRLWIATTDSAGEPVPPMFTRVRLVPDPDGLRADPLHQEVPNRHKIWPDTDDVHPDVRLHELPVVRDGAQSSFGFVYSLPDPEDVTRLDGGEPGFAVTVATSVPLGPGERSSSRGEWRDLGALQHRVDPAAPFVLVAELATGTRAAVQAAPRAPAATTRSREQAVQAVVRWWREFWGRSAVRCEPELESAWYRNQYFLACAVSTRASCPGLFGPWSYRSIGTEWHSDYHFNYNIQQPFWGVFSSNHAELHLPYADLVEHVLPISRKWAAEYYQLPGAAFPHSAYPVPMTHMPFPVPTWGWEICETPWAVQSLWWHYAFTGDTGFLAERAFGPLTEAVAFLVAYIEQAPKLDGRFDDELSHIFPSVVPELYSLTRGLTRNADITADLTLTRFVLTAWLQARTVLAAEDDHAVLADRARRILSTLASIPTAQADVGPVVVSVAGEDPRMVYNAPVAGMPVFPGEEERFLPGGPDHELAVRTWRNQRLEGGNELVFAALQGARLGVLDLDRWRRQLRYCTLPNGTATDLVLTTGGRYADQLDFDFMAPMGIWVENFAIPAVINECLVQTVGGVVRLFPNWPTDSAAEFRTLRVRDAYLVSAAMASGRISSVTVHSERGGQFRLAAPWPGQTCVERRPGTHPGGTTALDADTDGTLTIETEPGETLLLSPTTP